jgi:hypothetical protein
MQRVKESVTTDKSVDAIFAVLKDASKMPKWSILVESIEELEPGSYNANTKLGPLKFQWAANAADKKCTLTANIMGMIYSAFYMVSSEGGKTVITEDLPLNPMTTEDKIREAIRDECKKIIALA